MLYYVKLFVIKFALGVPFWLVLMGFRNRAHKEPFWNEWYFSLLILGLFVAVGVLFDAARAHGMLNGLVGVPVTREK